MGEGLNKFQIDKAELGKPGSAFFLDTDVTQKVLKASNILAWTKYYSTFTRTT